MEIGLEEYCSFLHKLYKRITMVVHDQHKRTWIKKFADLDSIQSLYDEEDKDDKSTASRTGAFRNRSQSVSLPLLKIKKTPLLRQRSDVTADRTANRSASNLPLRLLRGSSSSGLLLNREALTAEEVLTADNTAKNRGEPAWGKKAILLPQKKALNSFFFNPDIKQTDKKGTRKPKKK